MFDRPQTTSPGGGEADPTKNRVFISYSRKDGAFAGKLCAALIAAGYYAYLDTKDILPGEHWRPRLEDLIRRADAVVFLISPDSIDRWDSPPPEESVCAWEIRRTVELGKQLVPVLWRSLGGQRPPPELGKPNWVSFEDYQHSGMADEAAFGAALERLRLALHVAEALWVREHTRSVARAAEWDGVGRPEGKLLPPGDLAAAEAWARLRPMTAPELPPVLNDYLHESREKHERDSLRQRRIIGRAFVKPTEEALRTRGGRRRCGWPQPVCCWPRISASIQWLTRSFGGRRHVRSSRTGHARC